uniref:Oplophorus-luciferin 2-monooxygenase non-catalytic subunit n=1 Tax=Hemiscolopendra marginata TaxID=943146 RepID=A0A646QF19_9MYRI
MKISGLFALSVLLVGLSTSNSLSFQRHLLDVRSSAPCPSEWNISPCECTGRPSAPSMLCDKVKDTADLERILKANKENMNFRDIEIHGSALNSLPGNVFSPHTFHLFLLSNNSIQTVDKAAFKGSESNVQVLRLDGNKLTSFPFEALTGMKTLQVLELHRNQLTAIPDNAFPELETLANLDLGSNKIASIGKNAFSRLSGLGRLELSNNQLTSLGERSLAIDKQKQPVTLLLANNKIEKIDPAALAGLKVERLNLANNKLTTLVEEVFQPLIKDGAEISVEGNTFDCDQPQMTWLRKVPITLKQRVSGFKCKNGKGLDEFN